MIVSAARRTVASFDDHRLELEAQAVRAGREPRGVEQLARLARIEPAARLDLRAVPLRVRGDRAESGPAVSHQVTGDERLTVDGMRERAADADVVEPE